ncbi:MAG: hypothetical protein KJP21_09790 [Bacteroidia bacterium]|nr:hypothetical protein [Bacteroidia bacterium]
MANAINYSYTIKSYFPVSFKILGGVFVLLAILKFNPLTAVLGLLAILLFLGKEVIEIDFKNKQYRTGLSFFGANALKWKSFVNLNYVSIFPTNVSTTLYMARTGHGTTINDIDLRVNIVHNKKKRIHVYSAKSKENALIVAKKIGSGLNLRIYDCSGKEKVWIENHLSKS